MDLFLSLVSRSGRGTGVSPTRIPNCVAVWRNWLAENGPATRQTIAEATGVKFNERGTPHTVKWVEGEAGLDFVAPDTITRFLGLKKESGRGAPPTIYALWSQRYEVLPKFGVGPERPDPDSQSNESEPEALTGVIRPPLSSYPIDEEYGEEQPLPLDPEEPKSIISETPEEWAARVLAMKNEEEPHDG